jgi:phenylpropionate dioxygenase-like ring-hydroxylating dioxygenase large terminal subunit
MSYRYTKGWYQVAFERDLVEEVTPACLGSRRFILVRTAAGVRAFDADCPHRGAHLGLGGRVVDGAITCPFHHYRIGLGCEGRGDFSIAEYPVLSAGGMVFMRLSGAHDNGWSRYLHDLAASHYMINGFAMVIRTRAEVVIENAFDRRHFQAVHSVQTGAFEVREGTAGELIVEGVFFIRAAGDGTAQVAPAAYKAVVVSPAVAMVELQGLVPYTVVTGATDNPDGGCTIRLTLALPRSHFPGGPPAPFYEPLLGHSRRGLEEDRAIWENLSPSISPRWTADDHASLRFLRFCESFTDA